MDFPLFKFLYHKTMETTMPAINVFASIREGASALVRVRNRLIRNSRKRDRTDAEQWIEEFESLSGGGHSDRWRFDRDRVHRRRRSAGAVPPSVKLFRFEERPVARRFVMGAF